MSKIKGKDKGTTINRKPVQMCYFRFTLNWAASAAGKAKREYPNEEKSLVIWQKKRYRD